MSKQQLYINDRAVDMPTDEIKIKVESNIFSDADKIKTAHSYNIALPRTMTNDSIFALAYVPSAETGGRTTHTYLKASLYMDGVPLFVDGQAVINNVDEKGYNLNLFWGLLNIFDTIKEEGLQLYDLPTSKSWEVGRTGSWYKIRQDMADVFIGSGTTYASGIRYDVSYDDKSNDLFYAKPHTLPVVDAGFILGLIQEVYGLTFTLSTGASIEVSKLYHPLTTMRAMCDDEMLKVQIGTICTHTGSGWRINPYRPSQSQDLLDEYDSFSPIHPHMAGATNKYIANDAIEIITDGGYNYYKANTSLTITTLNVKGTCGETFLFSSPDSDTPTRYAPSYNPQTGLYEIDVTLRNISLEKGDNIFAFQTPDTSSSFSTDMFVTMEIEDVGELSRGDWMCIERNLPSFTIIDYISEMLAHCGACIVGSINESNVLRIMLFDEVVQNVPLVQDMDGLKTISMKMDDLAQKNVYTHEKNDDSGIDYYADGEIFCNDTTLKIEREAYKSGFKVPLNSLVRLFKVEKNANSNDYSLSWVASGDYICGYNNDLNKWRNTGQDFMTIIANRYTNYEQIVNHPKEIEVVVRLSVLDLLNFDMARPV
jgi:hypothetical protein